MRRNRGNFPAAWPSSGTMVECLASFVRVGHLTVLHAFDEIEDVPQGVESFDASRLMAADEIIRHRRTSSLALASDIHRHRILRENLGIYVDCDVPCLD